MTTNQEVIMKSYREDLLSAGRKLEKRFQQMRVDNPEGALAEAAVYNILKHCKVNPQPSDMPNVCGPDFHCLQGEPDQFMVEVTQFTREKMTTDTELPSEVPDDMAGDWYGGLTPQIDNKAREKIRQFKNLSMPGARDCVESLRSFTRLRREGLPKGSHLSAGLDDRQGGHVNGSGLLFVLTHR